MGNHFCSQFTASQHKQVRPRYKLFGEFITLWQQQCCRQIYIYKLKFVSQNLPNHNIFENSPIKCVKQFKQREQSVLNKTQIVQKLQETQFQIKFPNQLGSKLQNKIYIPQDLQQLKYRKYFIKKAMIKIIEMLQQDKSMVYGLQLNYDMFHSEKHRRLFIDAIIRCCYQLYLRKKPQIQQKSVKLRLILPQLKPFGFQQIQQIKEYITKEFKPYDMLRERNSLDSSFKIKK